MLDTVGGEEEDKRRPEEYHGTHMFIICYSVVSPDSYHRVGERWVPEITQHCPGTPFIIIGQQHNNNNNNK